PDRQTAAPIRRAGRNFWRVADRTGRLPTSGGGGAGGVRQERVSGGGEGTRGSTQGRNSPAHMGGDPVSEAPGTNLRPAATAVCPWKCGASEPVRDFDGGNATPDALRESNSRTIGARPGRTRPCDRKWTGARHRQLSPPRRVRRSTGRDDRRPGLRHRRHISEGEPQALRGG